MPDFPIVDAHVHIYDPNRLSYPWLKGIAILDRPYLPEDYARLTRGVDIEAMVFVEVDVAPGAHLTEVEFVQEQSRIESRLRAIVASMSWRMARRLRPISRHFQAFLLPAACAG